MKPFKVYLDSTKTIYTFRFPRIVCPHCGESTVKRPIRVTYKTPGKPMTIFESKVIVCAAYRKLSTARYRCPLRNYIDCQAGKEWLANIAKVEFI